MPNPGKDEDRTREQPAAELQVLREENAKLRRQVSEANTSDVKLNLAAAHIRAEAMAMRSTGDLLNVVAVLYQEMVQLDIEVSWCNIFFFDEERDWFMHFTAISSSVVGNIDPDYKPPKGVVYDKNMFAYKGSRDRPFSEWDPSGEVKERWRKGKPWTRIDRLTNANIANMRHKRGLSMSKSLPEEGFKDYTLLFIPFAHGQVVLSQEEYRQEVESVVQALTEALSLGFVRFLDFQRLEAANREIQKQTERKSKFLASMSHELRTPMNAIIGFTRMVLRREGDRLSERQQGNLEKVTQSADHLLDLINDILDLSKIEAGRMDVNVERFEVKNLVAGCCAEVEPLVAEKPDVKLTCEVSDDIGDANTDQGRVRQILVNLLSNAIKFTDKGEIAVRATKVDGLVIEVSDTGSGIPPDALETIFEEFQQVKGSDPQHKGTGLGLPICKGFAELLGGSIRVETEVGKGSTFTVQVPVFYEES